PVFAYPNGRLQDFDERAKDVLRARGVRWALSTAPGFADRSCDPLALPRLAVGGDASLNYFKLLVSGGLPRR
ncbi:polysaccharide deacetylase family protein, partial [Mycobacterium avium]|nr:polysaccharide deacetylase family protein [Mycobacterium avium]